MEEWREAKNARGSSRRKIAIILTSQSLDEVWGIDQVLSRRRVGRKDREVVKVSLWAIQHVLTPGGPVGKYR